MACSIRTGAMNYVLPIAIGSYDLLEAIAIEIAEGNSFWLTLNEGDDVKRRIWLSPNQPLELFNDGDLVREPDEDRVRTLRRSIRTSDQMIAGLAYVMPDEFAELSAVVNEAFEKQNASDAGSNAE